MFRGKYVAKTRNNNFGHKSATIDKNSERRTADTASRISRISSSFAKINNVNTVPSTVVGGHGNRPKSSMVYLKRNRSA